MDKGNKNQSLIAKVICLLLSLGLWLYISNVENPLRTYELKKIPVELINVGAVTDAKFAITENQEFTVDLKLEGPSSEVIKAKREDFKIVADMSAYALKNGENTIPVQIISYPQNINIKNNGFLGIKINLEDLIKKEISITSKVNVSYKPNIYEKDKSVTPFKITMSGAKSSVEKVNEAIISGDIKDVDKDIKSAYNIKFIDALGNEIKNIESDKDKAELSISVINGKSVPINLKTTGTLQNELDLDGFELNKSYINIIGSSQALENIKAIDTQPLDISNIQENSELNVKLNIPEGITIKDGEGEIKVKPKTKAKIKKDETVKDETVKDENAIKNIACNVNYINLNQNLIIESSTQTVNVSLSGTQRLLDNIVASNINVTMDLSIVTDEGKVQYTPHVTINNGENVAIVSVGNVDVVTKKKV